MGTGGGALVRRLLVALAGGSTLALVSGALAGATVALGAEVPEGPSQCSWNLKSNPNTINIEYPDLSATYWGRDFFPIPGERLAIKGEYPQARYFSFHVYDEKLVPLDSTYDIQIAPDAGSSNPFRAKPKPSTADSYTEYVDFTPAPSNPAPNTLYVDDTPQQTPTPVFTLMYRIYIAQKPGEPAGNVPLPQVTVQTTEGKTLESYGACASNSFEPGNQLNEEIANSNYPSGAPTPAIAEATDPPTWSRAFGSQLVGVWANQQNAYLKAKISRQYGSVVVIHGKAPTFPNNRAGQPPYAKRQVRYWSICENSEATRVISCAPDYVAALNKGYYTYVVSDPNKRPSNATAANGVTWLPWGGIFPSGEVIYRNMLPAPSFAQAVQNVPETASPQPIMGRYFPVISYCTTARFEAGGWKACSAG
jgi:hypothetical protein